MAALIEADWLAPARVTAFTTTRPLDQNSDLVDIIGSQQSVMQLRQVHGTEVVAAPDWVAGVEADACVSSEVGIACRILTADCLPLLICNRDATEIAAVHAGWRGLCAGIIEATLGTMESPPADLLVWLGPAISQAHFEVGEEVRKQFVEQAAADQSDATSACFVAGAAGKYFADLYQLARIRLAKLGVGEISGGNHCTYAAPDLFYSYRRNGASRRMQSVICLH